MRYCANDNCNNVIPSTVKIDGKIRNLCSRRFCLTCSPFGEHNTKPYIGDNTRTTKYCPKCDNTKPIEDFYKRRDGKVVNCYCKLCANLQTIERQRKLKADAVTYMGGKCADCKLEDEPCVYDFHHENSDTKDFTIGHCKMYSLERIKPELDKCILLCANCHRKRHFKNWLAR